MDENIQKSWERFLNPESLKENLVISSLYITSFEILKDSIISKIKDFFIEGIDEKGFIYSQKYNKEVLSLDNKKRPLQASFLWLKKYDVINDDDLNNWKKIVLFRNELAHDMLKFLTQIPESDLLDLFQIMLNLITKIEKWWIINYELEINENYIGQEISEEDIIPGINVTLHLLFNIALGEKNESKKYFEEFIKQKNEK
ncbi:hypothetical protein PJV89_01305 [Aliarcobacter butzleri]|jgi:hypothetical protein|uniref:hypothetical protein n=1 Tax=Aliarcobacter butzleri TaxID=28197 RepID=UPI000657C259|nr:hypothetical protein [Aliarcobacter butzleri]KLE03496.1 hypothetical protein AF78_10920 [Aliarcobacter butzleri L353]MCG3712459.1 hypothetical protein [Aliarcobacter butzleri]MCT7566211.1 hypothetical protein [Aliarcobacter butzleri]MDN5076818.1 hypothetical protein [Aliarcobacter butzleri]MDN5118026.1 hypothetical protein [Aliarcobacter butzleri]